MVEVIGWIGAVCFALCAVPQAWLSWRQGHSKGVSASFLAMWFIGEVCMLGYSLIEIDSLQIIVNYIFNLACLLVIISYKVRPRRHV